jgi:hypothetical protein
MKKVEQFEDTVINKIKTILLIMVSYFQNDELFNNNRFFFQMLVNEKRVMAYQASEEFLNRMQAMHKNMSQYFIEIFQKGIDSNELKKGNAELYSEIFLGIIHHYGFLVNIGLIEFNDDKSKQIIDLYFNGVKHK